jgi:adenine-specific DNA methylase
LKRTLSSHYAPLVKTPLTPKGSEIVQLAGRNKSYELKTARWFEQQMLECFRSWNSILWEGGIAAVMYAHKLTSAWESLISGLLQGGFFVTASWPLHTEMGSRLRAQGAAALASSIIMVCRKRVIRGNGIWDDVRQELKSVAQERLDFFWTQGIRGADFFISAIGPALSVFGKYDQVTRASGDKVTVGQFLGEVRSLVTNYALNKIVKTAQAAAIDPESRFYVIWKWAYGDAKVPADESFKLAMAIGIPTEEMWDRTGVLERSGENVQAMSIGKRIKVKNLGEPKREGVPPSLIDVLHRMCAFREKGDTPGMGEFLGRSGHANTHSLWLVAQAVSEILPDGDKEKQLMQGLLNQKDGLEQAARDKKWF